MELKIQEAVRGGTLCFSKAGIAIGTSTAKAKTAAPNGAGVDFAINGYMYHLADTDDFWTLSGDTIAIVSECLFLMCVNASGTMSVVQGDAILTADIDSGKKSLKWPQAGPTVCPIAGLKIVNTSATFVPGTTALTTVTTYYDFFAVPDSDITS